jgi:hypothetical protein
MTLVVARPWIVLALALAQAIASAIPDLLDWTCTIAERSARLQTPTVPIGFAFSIWSVIFAGSLAFAIHGLLQRNRDEALMDRIAWPAAAVFCLNTIWEIYVPLRDFEWGSLVIIIAAAVTANAIVLRIAAWRHPLTTGERWCVAIPMQIFAAWLTAATLVGLPTVLLWGDVEIVDPRSNLVAIAIIVSVGLVTIPMVLKTRALPYAATIIWALSGIVAANLLRDDNITVAAAAGLGAACLAIASVAVWRSAENVARAGPLTVK